MKKNTYNVKTVKVCMIISAVACVLTAAGLVIEFVRTGMWSGAGSSAAAVNCAIFCIEYDMYRKCKEDSKTTTE
ncbi:hypothetical protein [Ruminococcus sp.]|uniref:hypothetical protein n=1 Tax=Ruminococcus sp. TaxID=41978 RepID=UPI0025D45DA7|nr:hypothetical protein [Ruminococcus sp.]MBQ8967833.1 hypothetical protein [Ruminococcus sp.]